MAENKAPTLTPIKHIEYQCKQSKYGEHVPKLPMRSMILSPSGGGQTVLIQEHDIRYLQKMFQQNIHI